jgi:hypothetical protein
VFADDIKCTSTLTGRTIDGNVIVPAGKSCVLDDVYVKGNVEPRDRAQLLVRGGSYIEGSIQTAGANRVRVRDSEVNGNIQLTNVDYSQGSLVVLSQVGGTVDWFDNNAPFLIRYTYVGSDLKVNQNSKLAEIYDNEVDGNLQCQSNQPKPKGARNVVGGNKEDQCKKF